MKTENVRLIFKRDIPPGETLEVHVTSAEVQRDGDWRPVDIASLGLFRGEKIVSRCRELLIMEFNFTIRPESVTSYGPPPGKYNQFHLQPGGYSVDVFARPGEPDLDPGMKTDIALPIDVSFVIANRSTQPQRFAVDIMGRCLKEKP